MTTREDNELLIEEAASAYRPVDPREVKFHRAWHDLDDAGRDELFEVTGRLRAMEAALDPRGLSTTAHAVLARLARSR